MGSEILATDERFVFSAPFARSKQLRYMYKYVNNVKTCRGSNSYCSLREGERYTGSVVSYNLNSNTLRIAEGDWQKYRRSTKTDPHVYDLTGSAIIKGNFYETTWQSKEHFAIGAPKANNNFGKVYICYDCFASDRLFNQDKTIEGLNALCPNPQLSSCLQQGARFGSSLAAVDINGDGIHELVIGAPLYSSKVFGSNYFRKLKSYALF